MGVKDLAQRFFLGFWHRIRILDSQSTGSWFTIWWFGLLDIKGFDVVGMLELMNCHMPCAERVSTECQRLRLTVLFHLFTSFDLEEYFNRFDEKDIVKDLFFYVYESLFPRADVLGDKYNEYVFMLEELSSLFPCAKFIFIYRDPVDVASSLSVNFSNKPWGSRNLSNCLEKWYAWNNAMMNFYDSAEGVEKLLVSYLSLRDSASGVLERCQDFLGVEYSEEPILYCSSEWRASTRETLSDELAVPEHVSILLKKLDGLCIK